MEVPPRAVWLRALAAELERLANHFGDIGAVLQRCRIRHDARALRHCCASKCCAPRTAASVTV